MAEYIEREAFIADKQKQYCSDCDRRKGMKRGKLRFVYDIGEAPYRSCGIDDMLGDIEEYPAADVKPVVRGEWEEIDYEGVGFLHYECPFCGEHSFYKPNYCPNCGADMRGENDDNG